MKPTRLKIVLVALAALPLLFTACNPECVDRWDCTKKGAEGKQFTCVSNKCVEGSPFPPFDAGM